MITNTYFLGKLCIFYGTRGKVKKGKGKYTLPRFPRQIWQEKLITIYVYFINGKNLESIEDNKGGKAGYTESRST